MIIILGYLEKKNRFLESAQFIIIVRKYIYNYINVRSYTKNLNIQFLRNKPIC